MLLSFEKYLMEERDRAKREELLIAYPSVFELICLLPLSGNNVSLDTANMSSDDCLI
ncbi:hypothetical protein [Clostridium aminobutyricum]|uniref:Uncharacterized protein n=1 Tax=Clostridium aminobutyricum TaxID=33953 RepID=A0A939D5Y9_CLOAM|nr:hypothetical protein [Clostridium aminobutyricum]MBN7771964.1 hypothetical protein [Clostridium aminobutyricum]